jgi:hypothetical protein
LSHDCISGTDDLRTHARGNAHTDAVAGNVLQ